MSETNDLGPGDDVDVSDETRRRVLHARALRLALRPHDEDRQRTVRVVEFAVGSDKYAFETTLVAEVFAMRDLAPLPGTPSFVRGITNVRGRIVSVLDLSELFGSSQRLTADTGLIVILRSVAMEYAIAVDSVSDVKEIPEDSIQRSLSTATRAVDEYLLGMTPAGVVVLDVAKMLADPRLVVGPHATNVREEKGR